MRATAIIIFAMTALSAAAPAAAADLGPPNEHVHHAVRGRPAGPLVVYDFEPGTYVRAYFLPPWRNRHYYPTTGEQPISGRNEAIPADDREPAEKFYRAWSTSELFARDAPATSARGEAPAAQQPQSEGPPPVPSTEIRPDILAPRKRP